MKTKFANAFFQVSPKNKIDQNLLLTRDLSQLIGTGESVYHIQYFSVLDKKSNEHSNKSNGKFAMINGVPISPKYTHRHYKLLKNKVNEQKLKEIERLTSNLFTAQIVELCGQKQQSVSQMIDSVICNVIGKDCFDNSPQFVLDKVWRAFVRNSILPELKLIRIKSNLNSSQIDLNQLFSIDEETLNTKNKDSENNTHVQHRIEEIAKCFCEQLEEYIEKINQNSTVTSQEKPNDIDAIEQIMLFEIPQDGIAKINELILTSDFSGEKKSNEDIGKQAAKCCFEILLPKLNQGKKGLKINIDTTPQQSTVDPGAKTVKAGNLSGIKRENSFEPKEIDQKKKVKANFKIR